MTLNWTNVPFLFAAGLDTKSQAQSVPIGMLSELENGIFTNLGAINKRNGYSKLDKLINGDVTHIQTSKGSAIYNNLDLLQFDGNNVYSYLPSLGKWSDRGSCTSLEVDENVIISNSYIQTNADCVSGKGVELYVYSDSRAVNQLRYTMIDSITKSTLIDDQILTNNGAFPQCLQFGDYLIAVYSSSLGQIVAAVIAPGNPAHPTFYPLISDCGMTQSFDIASVDDFNGGGLTLCVSYANNSGGITTVVYDPFFNVVGQTTIAEAPNAGICCLGVFASNMYWIGYGLINGDVKCFSIQAADGSQVSDVTIIDTNQVIDHITAVQISGFNNEDNVNYDIQFYYDIPGGARPYIRTNVINYDGSGGPVNGLGTPQLFQNTVSLVSDAWIYNNRVYVNVAFDDNLQPTYFTLNGFAEVVSKNQDNEAGGYRNSRNLTTVNNIDTGKFLIATIHKTKIVSENNVFFNPTCVANVFLNFTNTYRSAMLGNVLHLTGGILQAYDGNSVVEHGFSIFPVGINNVPGFVGALADGTYTWQFCYEWTNNQGDVERSAPSEPTTLTLSNVTNSVLFEIPSLALTKKNNVRVVGYRTLEAGSGDPLLRRFTSTLTPVLNAPSSNFVLIVDTLNDVDIVENDVLYTSPDTTGNPIEIENIAAPNCTIITTYVNRVFISGLSTNPNQIWFSKTIVPGETAEFNDSFTIDIDPKGGSITAMAVMDANLIIFKEDSIYIMSGLGPTNTGANNDFNDPQQLASDVGCINPDSVVLVSSSGGQMGGIFFQSSKGIYLLNRSLQASYVGAAVEKFNSQHIVNSVQIPGTTQIRFVCSDGNCLVYDYYVNQWSTFTNHLAVSAGIWQDMFYFLNNQGTIFQEVAGKFTDDTSAINIKITTGWIKPFGIMNYQKSNSFLFLGKFFGQHKLKIDIGYDENENLTESLLIDTSTVITQHIYGQQNPYGENSPYGGTFANEKFRVFFQQQRNSSFKIRITEINTNNQGLTFIGMNIKLGQKMGLDKVAAGNQFGASR